MAGFSFASLILSYFLVAGGMFTSALVLSALKLEGMVPLYLLPAAGAFLGGFVAARASRASTILEPALGVVLVVGTIVGLAVGTPLGKALWSATSDETLKLVAQVGLTGVGGALAGAFVSERLLGEATSSSVPWLVYTALATFGASLLAALAGLILFAGDAVKTAEKAGTILLIGMGAGCLLAGISVGASARSRPLLAAMLGGGGGVAGFVALFMRITPKAQGDKDATTILVAFAVGGCVVTLIGALIGWVTVGRRHAS